MHTPTNFKKSLQKQSVFLGEFLRKTASNEQCIPCLRQVQYLSHLPDGFVY